MHPYLHVKFNMRGQARNAIPNYYRDVLNLLLNRADDNMHVINFLQQHGLLAINKRCLCLCDMRIIKRKAIRDGFIW